MTTKKQTSPRRPSKPATFKGHPAFHQLESLLRTMRCISQYEDTLCELSHEVKQAGGLSPDLTNEILSTLEKLPSHDYLMDLEALRDALAESAPGSKIKPERKPLKVAKLPGRKSSK